MPDGTNLEIDNLKKRLQETVEMQQEVQQTQDEYCAKIQRQDEVITTSELAISELTEELFREITNGAIKTKVIETLQQNIQNPNSLEELEIVKKELKEEKEKNNALQKKVEQLELEKIQLMNENKELIKVKEGLEELYKKYKTQNKALKKEIADLNKKVDDNIKTIRDHTEKTLNHKRAEVIEKLSGIVRNPECFHYLKEQLNSSNGDETIIKEFDKCLNENLTYFHTAEKFVDCVPRFKPFSSRHLNIFKDLCSIVSSNQAQEIKRRMNSISKDDEAFQKTFYNYCNEKTNNKDVIDCLLKNFPEYQRSEKSSCRIM